MLIVLEGCDGCGKTTLAENLAWTLGAEIWHSSIRTQNNFQYFAELIALGSVEDIIADRFMYGQFVYQTEEERRERGWLTMSEFHSLERMLRNTCAKVLHVTAPIGVIKERLKQREEILINNLTVEEVVHRFRQVMNSSAADPTEVDTSQIEWRIKR